MHERLLILDAEPNQAWRLGRSWVTVANVAGLVLGAGVAVALITVLTG